MFESGSKHFPLILVIIISFAFVGFALAHEGHDHALAQADASVDADITVTAPGTPVRPLDLARQRAMELKQNAANAKAQFQAGIAPDRQHAPSAPEQRPFMPDRMASTTDLIQKVRGAIYQHAGVIKQRFGLAIRHFEQFIERIEARLDKMAAAGIDTASVEAQLEIAKTAQAAANADIQAVHDYVESIDEDADRVQVRTQLQALVKTANESIKEAHAELQKTIRALVALAKEQQPEASASASVEAEAGVEAVNE